MSPDEPIPYIQRTHDWYLALGYGNPYRYAHFDDVPFQRLGKPLADCAVTLITTAAPYKPGTASSGLAYDAAAKFYVPYTGDTAIDHDLRITHVAIDRQHASLGDANCWFPLPLMRELAGEGRFRLAQRFHGVPTNRSQRHTTETDIPLVVQRCLEDGVEAALLVPNCPVCHQTLALTARALEQAGIATVVMGCAKDIVEHAGVPRFVFSDFPLGNAAGKPHDRESQRATLELALRYLETAAAPRTTVQSLQRWSDSPDWKLDYCNVERVAPEDLPRLRAEMDAAKAVAKRIRDEEPGEAALRARFLADIRENRTNRVILERWDQLALPDGWLVAGCLFQAVWNLRSGAAPGAQVSDYDFFYFDASDLTEAAEKRVQDRVRDALADLGVHVDVKNQARVHLWYEDWFGYPCPAMRSAREGIDRFLIPCTSVGVRMNRGECELYAPYGLRELYDGVLRPNPLTDHRALFRRKAQSYRDRWPWLQVSEGD